VKNLLAAFNIGDEFKLKGEMGIQNSESGYSSIGGFLSKILPNIYVLASLILFIILIVGGLGVIMGAGQENPERAKKGKQAMTAAVIGFAIIFCSYWIIKIIGTITGLDILGQE